MQQELIIVTMFISCSDVGISDVYLDRIINKLSNQLSAGNSVSTSIRKNGLSALSVIGKSRQDVVATILPRLIDSSVIKAIFQQGQVLREFLKSILNSFPSNLIEIINEKYWIFCTKISLCIFKCLDRVDLYLP